MNVHVKYSDLGITADMVRVFNDCPGCGGHHFFGTLGSEPKEFAGRQESGCVLIWVDGDD